MAAIGKAARRWESGRVRKWDSRRSVLPTFSPAHFRHRWLSALLVGL